MEMYTTREVNDFATIYGIITQLFRVFELSKSAVATAEDSIVWWTKK